MDNKEKLTYFLASFLGTSWLLLLCCCSGFFLNAYGESVSERALSVSYSNYLSITDGMTLDEVKEVMGDSCRKHKSRGNMVSYVWSNPLGGRCVVVIKNNAVISKNETGLD